MASEAPRPKKGGKRRDGGSRSAVEAEIKAPDAPEAEIAGAEKGAAATTGEPEGGDGAKNSQGAFAEEASYRALPLAEAASRRAEAASRRAPARAPRKADTLAGRPLLFKAIRIFLEENAAIEASQPVKKALAEMGKLTRIDDVFQVPLRRQILDLTGALMFTLFLQTVARDAPFKGEAPFLGDAGLNPEKALTEILECYDWGVKDVMSPVRDVLSEDDTSDEN